MLTSSTFDFNLVACIVIGYVIFTILYGYASLRARRASSGNGTGTPAQLNSNNCFGARTARFAAIVSALLVPAIMLAAYFSIAGRQRVGQVESNNLFVVAHRPNMTLAHLVSGSRIQKDMIVARFSSEVQDHRVAALLARKRELIAAREALKSASLTYSSDKVLKVQTEEQRSRELERRNNELERSLFFATQQLASAKTVWQRTRSEIMAQLPNLEQQRNSHAVKYAFAKRYLNRIKPLREKGYATISRLDQLTATHDIAKNRLTASNGVLKRTNAAVVSLDEGHNHTEALLLEQIQKLGTRLKTNKSKSNHARRKLASVKSELRASRTSAQARRRHEVEAASARIKELDSEIAVILVRSQVKSPISGRVVYRNETASRLTGTLPFLVIASDHGFMMRLDLANDELPALQQHIESGNSFRVFVDDGTEKRVVDGTIVRIEDGDRTSGRVTAVFGLKIPEVTLVRMTLKGVTPRAHLRWQPSLLSIMRAKIARALGATTPHTVRIAKRHSEPVPVPVPVKSRQMAPDKPAIRL